MEEYVDVLDDRGNKTGITKTRNQVHTDGSWHRVAHVWIVNDKKEILLQKRSERKALVSNELDVSAGGHLSAGDTSISGAVRETKEELGLDVSENELEFIATIIKQRNLVNGRINNHFEDMYILNKNVDPKKLKLQVEEVSDAFLVPYNEFKSMVENKDSRMVRREEEFKLLIKYVENM